MTFWKKKSIKFFTFLAANLSNGHFFGGKDLGRFLGSFLKDSHI
jgi:hypothetical protein